MHIYDFITDQEQYKMKFASRMVNKDEAFEYALTSYMQLFMADFDQLTTQDSKYLNDRLNEDPNIRQWFVDFRQLIHSDRNNIEKLFGDLIEVYEVFIGGKHQIAVNLLYHLLEKYDLLDNIYYEMLGCFFRGRWIEAGDDPVPDWCVLVGKA